MQSQGVLVGGLVDWFLSSISGVLDETLDSAGRYGGG